MADIKSQVIELIKIMPDDVTVDDIMAELHFKSQVDAGLQELDAGKGVPHEKVEERFSTWLSN